MNFRTSLLLTATRMLLKIADDYLMDLTKRHTCWCAVKGSRAEEGPDLQAIVQPP
jgi:hypothetical protein